MAVNKEFEAYKIRRELIRSDTRYTILRDAKNQFKELVEEGNPEVVCSFLGLYHEQNGYIQLRTGDTTQTRTKKIPFILCLFEDIKCNKIDINDYVIINGKRYNVTGVIDVQNWGIVADISLEVVDNG